MRLLVGLSFIFFFNDTATTEIYTLSLHDALPICISKEGHWLVGAGAQKMLPEVLKGGQRVMIDRKSTRLNSSHGYISYAVFCLKKKKRHQQYDPARPLPLLFDPNDELAIGGLSDI